MDVTDHDALCQITIDGYSLSGQVQLIRRSSVGCLYRFTQVNPWRRLAMRFPLCAQRVLLKAWHIPDQLMIKTYTDPKRMEQEALMFGKMPNLYNALVPKIHGRLVLPNGENALAFQYRDGYLLSEYLSDKSQSTGSDIWFIEMVKAITSHYTKLVHAGLVLDSQSLESIYILSSSPVPTWRVIPHAVLCIASIYILLIRSFDPMLLITFALCSWDLANIHTATTQYDCRKPLLWSIDLDGYWSDDLPKTRQKCERMLDTARRLCHTVADAAGIERGHVSHVWQYNVPTTLKLGNRTISGSMSPLFEPDHTRYKDHWATMFIFTNTHYTSLLLDYVPSFITRRLPLQYQMGTKCVIKSYINLNEWDDGLVDRGFQSKAVCDEEDRYKHNLEIRAPTMLWPLYGTFVPAFYGSVEVVGRSETAVAMQYLDGYRLHDLPTLLRDKPGSFPPFDRIVEEVARCFHALNRFGVAQNDGRPLNVMLVKTKSKERTITVIAGLIVLLTSVVVLSGKNLRHNNDVNNLGCLTLGISALALACVLERFEPQRYRIALIDFDAAIIYKDILNTLTAHRERRCAQNNFAEALQVMHMLGLELGMPTQADCDRYREQRVARPRQAGEEPDYRGFDQMLADMKDALYNYR